MSNTKIRNIQYGLHAIERSVNEINEFFNHPRYIESAFECTWEDVMELKIGDYVLLKEFMDSKPILAKVSEKINSSKAEGIIVVEEGMKNFPHVVVKRLWDFIPYKLYKVLSKDDEISNDKYYVSITNGIDISLSEKKYKYLTYQFKDYNELYGNLRVGMKILVKLSKTSEWEEYGITDKYNNTIKIVDGANIKKTEVVFLNSTNIMGAEDILFIEHRF